MTILDPDMDASAMQARVDAVFAAQETNQFGERRDAILFKPGDYDATVNVGFNTSVAGLGLSPDDVTINGQVRVDAEWFDGNATQNFWRSVENLSINPSDGVARWAVAQAAPMRRVHVRGALELSPTGYGWASGGYIADSQIDGLVASGSQQQWFSRDSDFQRWEGASWNMVFSGVHGAPADTFLNPPITVLDSTPTSREKPFLYLDSADQYQVFLPSLRHDSAGTSWSSVEAPGSSIPINRFYVARPSDTADTLNAALDQGLNLFLTPGIYHLDQTIRITHPDTVVQGIGLPTLIPDNGIDALTTSDVDGLRLAGFLIDAGLQNSETLLTIGDPDSNADHSTNPTTIQDVFFRIGGAHAGQASTSLVVNSDDVIIDHIWAWRADHGDGVGWQTNTADTGLIVNGDNVLATGLFVEHYQRYEVIWNGENGRTIFFQNELPYDPPNQEAWMNGSTEGYAAYKVADHVADHEAWGLGSYCYFNVDPTIRAARSFEAPDSPGVQFHNLLTVSLGGTGTITNVINSTGDPVNASFSGPSFVSGMNRWLSGSTRRDTRCLTKGCPRLHRWQC